MTTPPLSRQKQAYCKRLSKKGEDCFVQFWTKRRTEFKEEGYRVTKRESGMEPPACGSAIRTLPQQFLMLIHQQGGAIRPKGVTLPIGEIASLLWCDQHTPSYRRRQKTASSNTPSHPFRREPLRAPNHSPVGTKAHGTHSHPKSQ